MFLQTLFPIKPVNLTVKVRNGWTNLLSYHWIKGQNLPKCTQNNPSEHNK